MAADNRAEVVVPTIGESITSAFIASWFKQVGDYVKEGETLLEVGLRQGLPGGALSGLWDGGGARC